MNDFISLYIRYTEKTECPTIFHRWAAITSLGAYLGRSIHFNHGHFVIHPNLYSMLIGSPGTKKSSAIKIAVKLLKDVGYTTFAAKKTRQEKFLMDMAEQHTKNDPLDMSIFDDEPTGTAETFVAADEFNNFIGVGNLDFMSILGELWDYEGVYDYRLKNSSSVYIKDPTVSILGGNTPTGFAQAFPVEAIGQGFFSRLLLIYGEPTGVKYTFPPPPDLTLRAALLEKLVEIRSTMQGEITLSEDAYEMLDRIYKTWGGIDDARFEHYANRRLTQLLKLLLITVASRTSLIITTEDVLLANTMLTFIEHLMPKALGEFGKAKNSDVTHKVMTVIAGATLPVTLQELWKAVHSDLERRDQLIEILHNLIVAEKIQSAAGGYLPIRKRVQQTSKDVVDFSLLTSNERDLL